MQFENASFADRVVAVLLMIVAATVGLVLLVGFGLIVTILFIVVVKILIGFMIYRWWIQRRERQLRAESFRPRHSSSGSQAGRGSDFGEQDYLLIEVQGPDKASRGGESDAR